MVPAWGQALPAGTQELSAPRSQCPARTVTTALWQGRGRLPRPALSSSPIGALTVLAVGEVPRVVSRLAPWAGLVGVWLLLPVGPLHGLVGCAAWQRLSAQVVVGPGACSSGVVVGGLPQGSHVPWLSVDHHRARSFFQPPSQRSLHEGLPPVPPPRGVSESREEPARLRLQWWLSWWGGAGGHGPLGLGLGARLWDPVRGRSPAACLVPSQLGPAPSCPRHRRCDPRQLRLHVSGPVQFGPPPLGLQVV